MVNSISDCYQIWKKENQNTLNPLTFHRYNKSAGAAFTSIFFRYSRT